ncbi:MAG TPA: hypothetical protein VF516_24795 [Kofleriaceae bacterium]
MSITLDTDRFSLANLKQLIEMNPSIDWGAVVLDDPGRRAAIDWRELDPETMVPLVKAYQRLMHILPPGEERRALPLLESGLHSAIQIASIPRDEFLRRWGALFPGDEALGLAVHRAALGRRSELVLHHIHEVQRNEPHYRAARFK